MNIKEIILAAVLSFLITYIASVCVLPLLRRFKAGQTVLHYVAEHKEKSGTPTMGGIFIVLGLALSCAVFLDRTSRIAPVALAVTAGYGIIGFLDDYIKIKYKRNLGLRPYQKIAGQLLIAAIAASFAYKNAYIGGALNIPFTKTSVEIGAFIIPLTVLVYAATTNGVNLTDGLDGLAGTVSLLYTAAFTAVLAVAALSFYRSGDSAAYEEYRNLILFSACLIGALLCFLARNTFRASVFMGDTGSLALGGAAASIAVFSKNSLYVPLIGIMFTVSCISVIIQVLYFKRTKKRVFLMAPLHHHFQQKGHAEPKIVFWYALVTVAASLVCLFFLF